MRWMRQCLRGRSSPAIGSLRRDWAAKGCDPTMAARNYPDNQFLDTVRKLESDNIAVKSDSAAQIVSVCERNRPQSAAREREGERAFPHAPKARQAFARRA